MTLGSSTRSGPGLCAPHSGLRSAELQGLQWSDVDWHGQFIQVSRQIVRGKMTKLKNKHSRRKVDYSDDLLSTLVALKKTRQEEALKKGVNAISEWMFTNDIPPGMVGNVIKRSDNLLSAAAQGKGCPDSSWAVGAGHHSTCSKEYNIS